MTTEIVNYQKASKRSKLQNQSVAEGFEVTELLTINQHSHQPETSDRIAHLPIT